MKAAAIALVIWVLVVPSVVATFLVFTFIASFVPSLYVAAVSIALALGILTSIWGPLWFLPPRSSQSQSDSSTRNQSQENNHENCFTTQLHS
jgi:hypothetical protein